MKSCIWIALLLTIFLLPACASPYQPQAQAMFEAAQRGEITPAEYYQGITNLQALELNRRQLILNSVNTINSCFPPPTQTHRVYYYRVR